MRSGVLATDGRGVSPTIGYVFLVGIAIVGATVVVTFGGSALSDVKSSTNQQAAQDSMQELSHRVNDLSQQSTNGSTSIQIPDTGGDVGVREDKSEIKITVADVDSTKKETVSERFGTVYYEQGNSIVGLEGGGVWKKSSDSVEMLSKPALTVTDQQVQLEFSDYAKEDAIADRRLVAKRDIGESRKTTAQLMTDLHSMWQQPDVKQVDVTIEITSQFADGWETYAEQNFEDATVTRVDKNTVSIQFTDLPANSGSSPIKTATSKSEKPPQNTNAGKANSGEHIPGDNGESKDASGSSNVPPSSFPDNSESSDDSPPPLEETASGDLKINSNKADVTYLGSQLGNDKKEETTIKVDEPLSVAIVMDKSGSLDKTDSNRERVDAARSFVDSLDDDDRVSVTAFSSPYDNENDAIGMDYGFSDYSEADNYYKNILTKSDTLHDIYRSKSRNSDDPTPCCDTVRTGSGAKVNLWIKEGGLKHSAWTLQDMTSDKWEAKKEITGSLIGTTHTSKGLKKAKKTFDFTNDRKKVMVVFTDGQSIDGYEPKQAAKDLHEAGVDVFSVGLTSGDKFSAGEKKELKDIAGAGESQSAREEDSFLTSNPEKLEDKFDEAFNEITTDTAFQINHDKYTTKVSVGSYSGRELSSAGDETTFTVDRGLQFGTETTIQDCSSYTATSNTEFRNGNEYIHRNCDHTLLDTTTHTGYDVYTDGDTISATTEWWMDTPEDILTNSNDAGVSGSTVSLDPNQAIVKSKTPDGYVLYLVEATGGTPTADIEADKTQVYEGNPVSLDASDSSVTNTNAISYEWSNNVDSPSGSTATTSFEESGQKTVSVTVNDNAGGSATASVPITVVDRKPVAALAVEDTTPMTGEPVTFYADSKGVDSRDPDAGDTIEQYKFKGPSDWTSWQSASSEKITFTSSDKQVVKVKVKNSDDKIATTKITVDPVDKSELPKGSVTADPQSVYEGNEVEISVNTKNTIKHWIVSKKSKKSKKIVPDSGGKVKIDRSWDDKSTYTVTAVITKPNDPDVKSKAKPSVVIDVKNRKPVASVTTDSTVVGGRSVTIDMSESHDLDPGDEPLSYRYELVRAADASNPADSSAGFASSSSSDLVREVSGPGPKKTKTKLKGLMEPGVYRVKAKVTDNNGAQATTQIRITVPEDRSPVDVSISEVNTDNK